MAGGTAFLHRQTGIEQQHALPGPTQQAPVNRWRPPQIPLQLLEDVSQARWRPLTLGHGKGQPMCLAGPVVGVLTQDDHPHLGQGRKLQGPQRLRRINHRTGVKATAHKSRQRPSGFTREKALGQSTPVWRHRPASRLPRGQSVGAADKACGIFCPKVCLGFVHRHPEVSNPVVRQRLPASGKQLGQRQTGIGRTHEGFSDEKRVDACRT